MTTLPRRILGQAAPLLMGISVALFSAPRAVNAADWPLLRGNVQRSGVSEEKVAPPLSLLWRFTGPPQPKNPNAPAIVGNTVYYASGSVASGGGVVYALDVQTGAQKWRYPSTGGLAGHSFQTAPLISDGFVYIGGSDGKLYVLNAGTGELAQSFQTGGSITSSPAIYNGVLLFGSNDDTLYALNPTTLAPVWRQAYKAGDNVNSAPLVADNMVFFTTSDQNVHAVSAANGIAKWRFRTQFVPRQDSLVYADNTLYVAAGPRLHAFLARSGSSRWTVPFANDIAAPPVAAGGVVYVVDRERRMYALRANNARAVWKQPITLPYNPAAAPTISGDVIYIPTDRNLILAVSREDGKILWEYTVQPATNRPNVAPAPYTVLSAPISIANGALYALSDDGSLSAFRPDAPDTTPPLADRLFPQPGSIMSGAGQMTFAAEVKDLGSGLDRESIKISLDGQELDAVYDIATRLVYYRTTARTGANTAMSNGRHNVTLSVKDYRGNVREENWSFTVDNSLPATRDFQAPTAPRARPGTPGVGRPGGNRPGGNRPGGRPDRPRGGNRPGRGGRQL